MPFFSVIIPLYNKELFIENTLRSVLAQTFGDFEVIVVDDGSTDKSSGKVLGFKDDRIRFMQKNNEGASIARNFGIENATADYITFLDADDYWYPEFLETMKRQMEAFPDDKVFSAAIEIETANKTIFAAKYSVQDRGVKVVDFFDASLKECVICTSCAAFHKSIFKETGSFDKSIPSGQDIDLWIRIGLKYNVVFCSKILARYVFDRNSLSKNQSYTHLKLNFSKFEQEEKYNPKLKRYLDLNRFSMAIKSKINGDNKSYQQFRNDIDLKKLGLKKRILLELPGPVLRKLVGFREILVNLGLSNAVFK